MPVIGSGCFHDILCLSRSGKTGDLLWQAFCLQEDSIRVCFPCCSLSIKYWQSIVKFPTPKDQFIFLECRLRLGHIHAYGHIMLVVWVNHLKKTKKTVSAIWLIAYAILKEVYQRFCFHRILRKFGRSLKTLSVFNRWTAEGILAGSIANWFGYSTT